MVAVDKFTLCLGFLSLLAVFSLGRSDDVHSLSYNFIITYHRLEQRRCEIKGQYNGKPFLYYDSGKNKFQPVDSMGDEINANKVWEEQVKTLRRIKDKLMKQLNIMSEQSAVKFPFSLQGTMTCQKNGNGFTHGSWKFYSNGQLDLLFDSEKMIWTVVNPRGGLIKEKWEKDKDMIMVFKILMEVCNKCLANFLDLGKKELETEESPNMALTTATSINTMKNSTDYGIGTYITNIFMGISAFALAEFFLILIFTLCLIYCQGFHLRLFNPEDDVE